MPRSPVVVLALLALAAGCGQPSTPAPSPSGPAPTAPSSGYGTPVVAGEVESDDVRESSGLAASQCQDVLWTLNDSGNDAAIYGMDPQGADLGTWQVTNAQNVDWESIASYRDPNGACSLLIGDIGDNDATRPDVQIYRVPEPVVSPDTSGSGSGGSNKSNESATEPAQSMRFTYPDGSANAETLLVRQQTGDLYVGTKNETGPATIFRIPSAFGGGTVTGEKVADLTVPSTPEGRLTDGSIAPDGRRVVLCDERGGYELSLPDGAADPDAVWQQPPTPVDLGRRQQGEGVSYARDGSSVWASSEGKNPPLFLVERA